MFGRLQRLEDTIFTKEDAKLMEAQRQTDMLAMEARVAAQRAEDKKEMAAMEARVAAQRAEDKKDMAAQRGEDKGKDFLTLVVSIASVIYASK